VRRTDFKKLGHAVTKQPSASLLHAMVMRLQTETARTVSRFSVSVSHSQWGTAQHMGIMPAPVDNQHITKVHMYALIMTAHYMLVSPLAKNLAAESASSAGRSSRR